MNIILFSFRFTNKAFKKVVFHPFPPPPPNCIKIRKSRGLEKRKIYAATGANDVNLPLMPLSKLRAKVRASHNVQHGFCIWQCTGWAPRYPPNEERPFKWAQIKYGSAKCCTNKISADKKLQDRVVSPHISPCSVASKLCRLRSDTPHRPKEESLTCLLWLESSRRTWRPIKTRIRKVTIAWSRLKNQNVRHFHSIWRPTGGWVQRDLAVACGSPRFGQPQNFRFNCVGSGKCLLPVAQFSHYLTIAFVIAVQIERFGGSAHTTMNDEKRFWKFYSII